MNCLYPLEFFSTRERRDLFDIKDVPDTHMVSFISTTSLEVVDLLQPEMPTISRYTRPAESIQMHGGNHWQHWITKSTVMFGTRSGLILILKFQHSMLSDGPKEMILHGIIAATAVYRSYLLVFMYGGELHLINSTTKEVISTRYTSPHPFISNACVQNDRFFCLCNMKPYFCDLTGSIARGKQKMVLSPVNSLGSLSLLVTSDYSEQFTAITTKKTIIVGNSNTGLPLSMYTPHFEPIFVSWVTSDDFLMLSQNGEVVIRSAASGSQHRAYFSCLNNLLMARFVPSMRSLIAITEKNIVQIEFYRFVADIAYSATKIRSIRDMSCLDNMFPRDFLPIRCVSRNQNSYCIVGTLGFIVSKDNRRVHVDCIMDAQYSCVIGHHILTVCQNTVYVIDLESPNTKEYHLKDEIIGFSSSESHLAIVHPKSISILTPESIAHYPMNLDVAGCVLVGSSPFCITKALDVIDLSTGNIVFEGAQRVFSSGEILFVGSESTTTMVFHGEKIILPYSAVVYFDATAYSIEPSPAAGFLLKPHTVSMPHYSTTVERDYNDLFAGASTEERKQILLAEQPSGFKTLIARHAAELEAFPETTKEVISDALIGMNLWGQFLLFCKAAKVDMRAQLERNRHLSQDPYMECLESLTENTATMKTQPNELKDLGASFMSLGFLNWALACFILSESKPELIKVLQNPQVFSMALKLTREAAVQEKVKVLCDLGIGL